MEAGGAFEWSSADPRVTIDANISELRIANASQLRPGGWVLSPRRPFTARPRNASCECGCSQGCGVSIWPKELAGRGRGQARTCKG